MRQTAIYARALPAVLACLLALATSACSNAPDGNRYVDYDGKTLVVEGKEHPLDRTTLPYWKAVPGRTVIQARPDALPRALHLIDRYGLTLEGHSERGWLVVKVPEGYEWQWMSALQQEMGYQATVTTGLDSEPLRIAGSGPGSGALAVGEPAPQAQRTPEASAPAREPTPAEVRQAFHDRYVALERGGGMVIGLPSNGASTVVHARLYDVSKATCSPSPQSTNDSWECSAVLKRSICSGDCTPSFSDATESPERISVTWNPATQRFDAGR